MANRNEKWKNEQGLALIVAVLITSALVAIGSFAMVMTNTELDISKNDRCSKESFYSADSADPIYSRVIGQIFFNNDPTPIPGWQMAIDTDPTNPAVSTDVGLVREVGGLNRSLAYDPDQGLGGDLASDIEAVVPVGVETEQAPDLQGSVGGRNVAVDIDWRFSKIDPGTSVLNHEGYEATGIKKESRIYFDVRSVTTTRCSTAELHQVYKY